MRENILNSEAHFIPSSSEAITVFIPDIASSTHGSILSTFTLDNRYIYKHYAVSNLKPTPLSTLHPTIALLLGA